MNDDDNEDVRAIVRHLHALFWVLMFLGLLAYALRVNAQAPQTPEETLAALCVHEAGWDRPGDCWVIYAVLANNAEALHTTWLRFARRHSRRFFGGTSTMPWARELRDSDETPAHFFTPSGHALRWLGPRAGVHTESRRERFHALVELAYEILRTPPTCPAMSWGSRDDYTTGVFALAHARDTFVTCSELPARNPFSYGADPE